LDILIYPIKLKRIFLESNAFISIVALGLALAKSQKSVNMHPI